jgi:nicotinamide-nucleotide amidase
LTAEIITVGDEILIGQIVDTNSAWMAQKLNAIGVGVVQITSVHDDLHEITQAFKLASERSAIVLITGGLGPTRDDITKKALCHYFETDLVLNISVLDNVYALLNKRNIPVGKSNELQAWVPKNCTVIQNINGTAPAMWFEKSGVIYVSMPGVPFEMKGIMEAFVLPEIVRKFSLPSIIHKTLMVVNIPESILSNMLNDFENNLPPHIKLAYLPHLNTVRLRLSGKSDQQKKLEKDLREKVFELRQIVKENIASEGDKNLAETIGENLRKRKQTLATAESCTGGYIAHLITSIPGSSEYYLGSVVSYANQIKEEQLKVSRSIIHKHGAVSEAVVVKMAEGLRKTFKSDYAIATSGIAGPGGGTLKKPVGTVWICVESEGGSFTRKFMFQGSRLQIIERSALTALEMLRRLMNDFPID